MVNARMVNAKNDALFEHSKPDFQHSNPIFLAFKTYINYNRRFDNANFGRL